VPEHSIRFETVAPNTTGGSVDTLRKLNPDGSLNAETVTTTSANGLAKTTQQDTTGALDGSGNPLFDLTETDVTVLNADGSATETVNGTSANGTLLTRRSRRRARTGCRSRHNRTRRRARWQRQSDFDLTETDVTVLNADGSTTETVTDRSANGRCWVKTVTTTSADRRTQTVQIDSQGDGTFNEVQSRTVNANGSVTVTVTDYAANGALLDEAVTTTRADACRCDAGDIDRRTRWQRHPVFDLTASSSSAPFAA